ncbi:transcriptional regulator, ArsR family [Limimonas halophila]|uniref:Transcriptional regulator, ArsR family n=1 Tax=Limimonas halophila TaxID=1082479 RepID=A0A1G7MDU5_9PROT|nr:metalloregulator ArsR/SmtB family transcription factor [Limimonas halophila]SDF59826.1 transcriptional regulator, ArsR family [Limimonas halophila]
METQDAVPALAALAQSTRLNAFRALVQAGPDGMAQGELARCLDVQPATLSFHLQQLEQAGLVHGRRQSRHIYYAADYEGMRRLLAFLTEDCCGGRPEICGDLANHAAECAADDGDGSS